MFFASIYGRSKHYFGVLLNFLTYLFPLNYSSKFLNQIEFLVDIQQMIFLLSITNTFMLNKIIVECTFNFRRSIKIFFTSLLWSSEIFKCFFFNFSLSFLSNLRKFWIFLIVSSAFFLIVLSFQLFFCVPFSLVQIIYFYGQFLVFFLACLMHLFPLHASFLEKDILRY